MLPNFDAVHQEISDQIENRRAIRGENYVRMLEFLHTCSKLTMASSTLVETTRVDRDMYKHLILKMLSQLIELHADALGIDDDMHQEIEQDVARFIQIELQEFNRAAAHSKPH